MTEKKETNQPKGGIMLLGVAIVAVLGVAAWAFLGGSSGSSDSGHACGGPDAEVDFEEGKGPGGVLLGTVDSSRPEVGQPAPDFILIDGRCGDQVY